MMFTFIDFLLGTVGKNAGVKYSATIVLCNLQLIHKIVMTFPFY